MIGSNKNITWTKYFNMKEYEVDVEYYSSNGNLVRTQEGFKTARYPYLVVEQWLSKILSETPSITKKTNEEETNSVEELENMDYKPGLGAVLGYGEVIIVPQIINDKLTYQTHSLDDVEFIENNGELVHLTYLKSDYRLNGSTKKWEEIILECVHEIDKESMKYTYREMYEGRIYEDRFSAYDSEFLAPFTLKCRNMLGGGQPVYATGVGIIEDLNKNDYQKSLDRKLSRKTLFVPDTAIEKSSYGQSLNNTGYLNDATSIMRIMPAKDREEQMPMIFDGGYNPTPYIEDSNQLLHMLSLACGFGPKYLSFDGAGSMKTATEVVSEKSDLYQNKKMHDKTLKELIERIYRGYLILTNANIDAVTQLEIEFSDNIIIDDEARRVALLEEYNDGLISQEYYLRKTTTLTDDEIALMIANTSVEEIDFNA